MAARDDDAITQEIRAQRGAFEKLALASPLEPAPHNDEIGFDLRRFTAVHQGVTIVRYLHHRGRGPDERPALSLGAYVFRDGKVPAFVKLDISQAKALIDEMDKEAESASRDPAFGRGVPPPKVGMARGLWRVFLAPLW